MLTHVAAIYVLAAVAAVPAQALGDRAFARRHAASRLLEHLGPAAWPALDALAQDPDGEVRRRAACLLRAALPLRVSWRVEAWGRLPWMAYEWSEHDHTYQWLDAARRHWPGRVRHGDDGDFLDYRLATRLWLERQLSAGLPEGPIRARLRDWWAAEMEYREVTGRPPFAPVPPPRSD